MDIATDDDATPGGNPAAVFGISLTVPPRQIEIV
jgi:hypothetical protein